MCVGAGNRETINFIERGLNKGNEDNMVVFYNYANLFIAIE